jgi:hypothetical protein
MNIFAGLYQSLTSQVKDINTRYSKPSIQITPLVRICLLFLRFYLFLLIGLLIYKFIAVVRQ